jgi:hypothetical protein
MACRKAWKQPEMWGNATKQQEAVPGGMEAVCLSGRRRLQRPGKAQDASSICPFISVSLFCCFVFVVFFFFFFVFSSFLLLLRLFFFFFFFFVFSSSSSSSSSSSCWGCRVFH